MCPKGIVSICYNQGYGSVDAGRFGAVHHNRKCWRHLLERRVGRRIGTAQQYQFIDIAAGNDEDEAR